MEITKILCAAELEFIPQELEKLPPQVKNFQARMKKLFHEKVSAANNKRAEILKNFMPQEIMMFDLHEHDEKTKDRLEFIFGTGRGDNSYYDAVIGIMRCLEIKTKPVPLEKFHQTLNDVLFVLNEKAEKYGIKITKPKIQLNISFWQNNINIFDPGSEVFRPLAPKILSGILQGIYDRRKELPFLYISSTGAPPLISLKVGREGFARLVGEGERARLELRLSRAGANITQIDVAQLLEIIKFESLTFLDKKPIVSQVKRCVFKRSDDDLKITTHVLLGSMVKRNFLRNGYRLIVPKNYISGWLFLNFAKIALELGFEPISPSLNIKELKFLHKEKYDELMNEYKSSERARIEYLKQLKNKKNRNRLEDLEYDFLRGCYKKSGVSEIMEWPNREIFYAHFSALKANSVLLEEINEFFASIRLSNKLQIVIKPKEKFLRAAQDIKNKIIAEKIVDSFIMEENLLIT